MSLVAVITRTKNRPILLRRAMRSVVNQTFRDFEWIVINDGGDCSPVDSICSEAKKLSIRVKTIHHDHSLGMEAASNKGIKQSDSKYVVIHDDDDSWHGDFLAATCDFLENPNHSKYDGVITNFTTITERVSKIGIHKIKEKCRNIHSVYLHEMARVNVFPPICFLFKRSMYDKIGSYDELLPVLGDWDFNLRFLMESDIGVIKRRLANYHLRELKQFGVYENTVIHKLDLHHRYDAVIRNKYLRSDLKRGCLGLGGLLALERDLHELKRSTRYIDIPHVLGVLKSQTFLRRFLGRE